MSFLDIVRFGRRLGYYFRSEQSRQFCQHLGLGHGYICIDARTYFQCPSSPVAYSVFQDMAFSGQGRQELNEFLDLSRGCRSFVDVGASGGFFSVLFATSRTEKSTVLSIEPDPGAREVLTDLRNRNGRKIINWQIESGAVMDRTQNALFVSSGYGAEVMTQLAETNAQRCAAENNLRSNIFELGCATLSDLLSKHSLVPDLLKIDIESYEYELLKSSVDILHVLKPRIMLELHVALLQARGRDLQVLLDSLASIGYRRLRKPWRTLSFLAAEADSAGVVRVGLFV